MLVTHLVSLLAISKLTITLLCIMYFLLVRKVQIIRILLLYGFLGLQDVHPKLHFYLKLDLFYCLLKHHIIHLSHLLPILTLGTKYPIFSLLTPHKEQGTVQYQIHPTLITMQTQQKIHFHLCYISLARFPSLKTRNFYIAGSSYGGKFIPDLALRINNYNLNVEQKINLKGILVGNGVMDLADNQLEKNQINYMFERNLIDPTLDKYWTGTCQVDPKKH